MSLAFSQRLTAELANRGIDFVAARVSGGPGAAAEGQLSVLAAGADQAMIRARPLLETFSREITVAGDEPWQANAAKPRQFSP